MLIRFIVAAAIPVICSGCFAQYDVGEPLANRISVASATASVKQPEDGSDERPETYRGSGEQVATELRGALTSHGVASDVGYLSHPLPNYVYGQRGTVGRSLHIEPTIELWSDRITEWSGKLDELRIRVVVVDNATGATVDDRLITAKSKWSTLGGDHPQQMLGDLFSKWADAIFAKPTKS